MAAPNSGPVYYCRAAVMAPLVQEFGEADGSAEGLEEQGCKEGSPRGCGPRRKRDFICRGCQALCPQYWQLFNNNSRVAEAWTLANIEDEAQSPGVGGARARSRSPRTLRALETRSVASLRTDTLIQIVQLRVAQHR